MVDLPEIPNRVPQAKAPESRVTPAQINEPYTLLAANLDLAAQRLSKDVAEPAATAAGLQAVQRDPQTGQVTVAPAPLIVGDAGHNYARAVRFSALTEAEGEARRGDIALREQFRNDPGAFDENGRPTGGYLRAAQEYRTAQVANWTMIAGPEVGQQVGRIIERETTTTYRGLLNERERLDLQRAQSSITARIATTQNEMFALAASGGTDTPEFRERGAAVRQLYSELVNNPRLAYPRERADAEISHMDSELRAHATVNSITGVMEREGAEAAMREADSIRTDPGLNLTHAQRDAYYSRAVAAINQRVTQARTVATGIGNEITAIDRIVTDGGYPTPDRLAAVRQAVAEANNPELTRQHDAMAASLPTIAAWRQLSPAQLESELANLQRTTRESGDNERTIWLRDAGQRLLTTMRTEIQRDPLGWADRVGLVTVPPIEFGSPQASDDMRHRAAIADTIARNYGITPMYLRPEERRALEVAATSGAVPMQQVAQLINQGFGARSPRVFAELGQQAPVLAHLGGLLSGGLFGGGSPAFANDVSEGVALMRNEETRRQLPHWARTPNDRVAQFETNRRVDQYGDAFIMVPDTGRAADQSARTAFTVRALRHGYDPSQELDRTSPTQRAYNRTLQEGAGASFQPDGTQYGGVTSYSVGTYGFRTTRHVLVPGSVRADQFRSVIGAIRDDDLRLMAISPQTTDGRTYTASDLRQAVPVAVPGGYRFAQGDPGSDDPRWIRGADGRPFVLDFDAMAPTLRTRVPGAFAGGR